MIETTDRFCCFPLETGIKWFGYLSAAVCMLGIVINLIMLMGYQEVVDEQTGANSESLVFVNRWLIDQQTSCIVMLVSCALGVGLSYMLVMAVERHNRKFLLPWLICNAFSVVFWTIVLCPILVPMLLVLSPIVSIYYLWYCIYSLFAVLREEELNQFNKASVTPTEVTLVPPQYVN